MVVWGQGRSLVDWARSDWPGGPTVPRQPENQSDKFVLDISHLFFNNIHESGPSTPYFVCYHDSGPGSRPRIFTGGRPS